MAALTKLRCLLLHFLVAAGLVTAAAGAVAGASATEQQVKAVFVYNFSHFVEWPRAAFASPTDPFVIGVLADEGFATLLEEVVRGEDAGGRPIQVQRVRSVREAGSSHILFIGRTMSAQIPQLIAALDGRGTLTVSDLDNTAESGVMVQLAKVNNRIRIRINIEAARNAGLSLNSNLLRSADIVRNTAVE